MKQKQSFSQKIVTFLMGNAVIWIYLSYYLAYIGRTQIAETLSKTVVVEVIGVVIGYYVKAGFENISKNNTWPDKPKSTGNTDRDC